MLKDFPILYGPLRLSFGDLTRAERLAGNRLRLKDKQKTALGWILQLMNRDKYQCFLDGIVDYKISTLSKYAAMDKGDFSRALTELETLCIIVKHKGEGNRISYGLSDQMATYLYQVTPDTEKVQITTKAVNNTVWTMGITREVVGDGSNNLVGDGSNNLVGDGSNNLVGDGSNSYLYIEASPSYLSPSSLLPSSSLPAAKPVDNKPIAMARSELHDILGNARTPFDKVFDEIFAPVLRDSRRGWSAMDRGKAKDTVWSLVGSLEKTPTIEFGQYLESYKNCTRQKKIKVSALPLIFERFKTGETIAELESKISR